MPGMSNKPITEVARPGYVLPPISQTNLSFSSEWKTPKVLKQTTTDYFNIIDQVGYIPKYLGFRGLGPDTIAVDPWNSYIAGGYSVGDFTYCDLFKINYEGFGGVMVYEGGDVENVPLSGYNFQEWSDNSSSILFFAEALDGTPPIVNTSTQTASPVLLVGDTGVNDVLRVHPSNNIVDSRLDTLKIFRTGTLTLSVPSDASVSGEKQYSTYIKHNLGYAPIYMPEASVGWVLSSSIPANFVVNDYMGFSQGPTSRPGVLDVYTDSTKLYLRYRRFAAEGARTITMYYTIFYNQIGEELDLS